MSNDVTMYHNPKCSKSRATLQLLQENGVEPVLIEYLKTPPSESELDQILNLLTKEPRELMRQKEAPYAANALDNANLARGDLIKAMINDPILIERPIVLANGKAAVGRPPEAVLEII